MLAEVHWDRRVALGTIKIAECNSAIPGGNDSGLARDLARRAAHLRSVLHGYRRGYTQPSSLSNDPAICLSATSPRKGRLDMPGIARQKEMKEIRGPHPTVTGCRIVK